VIENRVLRKMFEPKREEIAGGWRKWYERLHYFVLVAKC
jgi:hypothetical protein